MNKVTATALMCCSLCSAGCPQAQPATTTTTEPKPETELVTSSDRNLASQTHAVVLVYHHVAGHTPASTSISPQAFEAHLDYITSHDYVVKPLSDIVAQFDQGKRIAANTIAITFDDAYASILEHAHGALTRRNMPYTVFASTSTISNTTGTYLSWAQLSALRKQGVEIGNHSHSHAHLLARLTDEVQSQWLNRINQDVQQAQQLITQHTGATPKLFAYPYGEYDLALGKLIRNLGLTAFAQHSGAFSSEGDFAAIPRFAMGGSYTSLERLKTALASRPLPVQARPPGPTLLTQAQPTSLQLTIIPGAYDLDQLACYATQQGRMDLKVLPDNNFVITPSQAPRVGRSQFNCTAPHSSDPGTYYWWSHLIMRLPAPGVWYEG